LILVNKKCVICETEFEAKQKLSKCCSKQCRRKYYKLNPRYLLKCKHCSKDFKSNNKKQIYCSVDCASESGIFKETGKISGRISIDKLGEREEEFKVKFENRFPGFEYVKGYSICESKIICKCNQCGVTKERSAQCVRSKKEVRCDTCSKIKSDNEKQNKNERQKRAREETIKKTTERNIKLETKRNFLKEPIKCGECGDLFSRTKNRQINCTICVDKYKAIKLIEKEELKKHTRCKECDELFIRKRLKQPYCSNKCRKRYGYRVADIRRRKRLKENGLIEWDINIERLIKRDGQICKICGGYVNLKDFHYTEEGHFIARDKYPSIDHIKPVSKGGTHTWDNVQLAHRQCNSFKCDDEEFIYDVKLLI